MQPRKLQNMQLNKCNVESCKAHATRKSAATVVWFEISTAVLFRKQHCNYSSMPKGPLPRNSFLFSEQFQHSRRASSTRLDVKALASSPVTSFASSLKFHLSYSSPVGLTSSLHLAGPEPYRELGARAFLSNRMSD